MRSGVEVCLYLSIAGPAFPCRAPREKIEGDDGTGEGRVSHIKMLSGAGGGGAGGGSGGGRGGGGGVGGEGGGVREGGGGGGGKDGLPH